MLRQPIFAVIALCAGLVPSFASAQPEPETAVVVPPGITVIEDVRFATVNGHELFLDLYMPQGAVEPPLLVWVHGGLWSGGSRKRLGPATGQLIDGVAAFLEAGYALASIDHRLSGVAPFPAQIHDIKGAIRFLRTEAGTYGYDARRVAILGVSSGGHLAALAATTNGHAGLEGSVGGNLDQSSDIAAVVSYFGASNLTTILAQSTPSGLNVRVPALTRLYGGPPEEKTELARLASPVFHVDAGDPPLLLLHGDQDPQMPINQAHELHGAYKSVGLDVQFEVVHGAAHGGGAFFDAERTALVLAFLDRNLRNYVSDARDN